MLPCPAAPLTACHFGTVWLAGPHLNCWKAHWAITRAARHPEALSSHYYDFRRNTDTVLTLQNTVQAFITLALLTRSPAPSCSSIDGMDEHRHYARALPHKFMRMAAVVKSCTRYFCEITMQNLPAPAILIFLTRKSPTFVYCTTLELSNRVVKSIEQERGVFVPIL